MDKKPYCQLLGKGLCILFQIYNVSVSSKSIQKRIKYKKKQEQDNKYLQART